jgi:multidrug efflux pump subunit AcrB
MPQAHSWFRRWLARPVAVTAWAVALLLAGAWAALHVPLEWTPQVELPEVRLHASWPGASPRAVEQHVTAPLERAIARVAGTAGIESLSEEGGATIIAQVDERVALGPYVAQVNEQVALVRETMPPHVYPRLTKQVPEALRDEQGFMTLQLVGPEAPEVLHALAEERLAPALRSLPGVADVAVEGGRQRELRITLDPARLAAHGVSPEDVLRELGAVLQDETYGRLRSNGRAVLLLSPAEDEVEQLRKLVIDKSAGEGVLRLGDLAELTLGPAPVYSISRIDGDPVVTLTLERARGHSMLAVAGRIRDRLGTLRAELPDGTRVLVADDRTEAVREQLRDLAWRGGLGLLLVVLVLLFMLQSVRAAGVVLFSVAVSLAVALALIEPLGLTLNLLTLAGLVLVFGLLVDNAVVVVEQYQAARKDVPDGAVAEGVLRRVWLPLLGGTLSTMAVMLPLLYLSGELRALFLPFGVLVGLTLGASLAGAVLLVPVLCRLLPAQTHLPARPAAWTRWVAMPYCAAARFPRLTLLALALLIGFPLWLLPLRLEPPGGGGDTRPVRRLVDLYNATLGSEPVQETRVLLDPLLGGVTRPFVAQVQFGARWEYRAKPEAYVRFGLPPGSPIERADSLVQRFETVALASPAVMRTIAQVQERQATLRVQFTPEALVTAEPYLVRERMIQQAVLIAGIDVSVGGLSSDGYSNSSGMNMSGLRLVAQGPNYEALEALTEQFARFLQARSRRVTAVHTNANRYYRQAPREVLRFRWDSEAVMRSGVSTLELAETLRPLLSTRFPSFYTELEGRPRLPIRILVDGAEALDVADLAIRPLPVRDSLHLQLAALADYTVEQVPTQIERQDQQYVHHLIIDYLGPYRLGDEVLETTLAQFPVPPGYSLERDQQVFFTDEVQHVFGWVLLTTLGLIFLITAAVFESWRLPLLVLLSVPTAAVGVAAGFLWADAAFAEGAFIGIVLLAGIAVNDSILLADHYRHLRCRRPTTDPPRLMLLAVRDRLRPMWTTTLSSVAAMLPLIVFPDDGSFWLALAVAVVGGLLASTLLAPLASVALVAARHYRSTS